jgi:hypothetical protein
MKELHSPYALAVNLLREEKLPQVVMMTGHIGAGKNYVAKEAGNKIHEVGFTVAYTSFASSLKRLVYRAFGLLKNVTPKCSNTDVNKAVEIVSEFFSKYTSDIGEYEEEIRTICRSVVELHNIRYAMQRLGELGRKINSYIWILETDNILRGLIKQSDIVFITDLRYPNELEFVKGKYDCRVVRVVASMNSILNRLCISKGEYELRLEHESEKAIDQISDIDYLVVNE